MKKLLKFTLASFLVLVVSVSCQRRDEALDAPVLKHSFVVEAELPGMEQESTKGYLGSYIGATWSKGDKVSVVNLTTGMILGGELSSDREGTKTTFTGTVTGTISVNDRMAVVYPSFELSEETDFGDSREFNLSKQKAASNVPLVTYATFIADEADGDYSGLELSFYYALSYLKMNLANLPSDTTVSKVTLRNVPVQFTVSINGTKTAFDISTESERAAKGKLEIEGPFSTDASGTMTVAAGVMPSDETLNRSIVVTIKDDCEYISSMASAQLLSHRYYNTVVSGFEKIALTGKDGYGVYNLETGDVMDEYDELSSSLIVGTENGENDFSLLNTSASTYWTVKGIPSDVDEGTPFAARLYNYGIVDLPSGTTKDAAVRMMEQDGDFTKLWVKAGDYLFIVRK